MFWRDEARDETRDEARDEARRKKRAAGKIPMLGILKRGGNVYTALLPDVKSETLVFILGEKVHPESIVYTDSFCSYDVLESSEFHHYHVNHQQTFVTSPKNHSNDIENFWKQAKRHLRKYNGIPKQRFLFFMKECRTS